MKKILKTAVVILVMAVWGADAWASTDAKAPSHLTPAQIEQLRAQQKQRHQKISPAVSRKVGGKAVKGAKKVSPDPVKKEGQ